MAKRPLNRQYGTYRIEFRKSEHLEGRPTPHVEVWKGNIKIGNYDMSSGRPLNHPHDHVPQRILDAISAYLQDPQVKRKVADAIESSFFDLSKPFGKYGGVPKGFKVSVSVKFDE
jgi:hypothetical protein